MRSMADDETEMNPKNKNSHWGKVSLIKGFSNTKLHLLRGFSSGSKILFGDSTNCQVPLDGEVSGEVCPDSILRGTKSLRVSRGGTKCEQIELRISTVPLAVEYETSERRRRIYFEQISEVKFCDALKCRIPEDLMFSIVYAHSPSEYRRLNVVMPTVIAKVVWTTWLTETLSSNWADQYLAIVSNILDARNAPCYAPGRHFGTILVHDWDKACIKHRRMLLRALHGTEVTSRLFNQLVRGQLYIDFNAFFFFMRTIQKSSYTDTEIHDIYTTYSNSDNLMSKFLFVSFLTSSLNSAQERARILCDMDRPINDYYINTSHNTYLTKTQFGKGTSLEAYARALKSGCRCVEIDCHDGPDGIPLVYHKGSFTKGLKFPDVIRTIREYAFKSSPYPLILSLEIRCSEQQRRKMADIILKGVGDILALGTYHETYKPLPSPESLKYRIILRGKHSRCTDSHTFYPTNGYTTSIPTLKDLITYLPTFTLRSCIISMMPKKYGMSFSVSERDSAYFKNAHGDKYFNFNKHFPVRVYPSPMRIMSSNFNPLPHWEANCSMVAMNHQTKDKWMEVYTALFELNRSYGYVPKPVKMRRNQGQDHQPTAASTSISITLLSLNLLTSKNLCSSNMQIEIELIEPGYSLAKYSKLLRYNHPVLSWNQRFIFTLHNPDLAFIRFKVTKVPAGNFSPISRTVHYEALCAGYRTLSLSAVDKCTIIPPSLLMFIER